MEDTAFVQFRSQIFSLYDREAYQEALDLIEERAAEFQQYESDLFFWRACLAGCMGDGVGGLDWLRQASERGHWYHERMLRDPDLNSLREIEGWEELLAVFRERCEKAQADARPERVVWGPTGVEQGLLVTLHGSGGSILTEGCHWKAAADLGWRVAMLQSSQVFAPGRYYWGDKGKATQELRRHLSELGAAQDTVLAGFSAGAGLALQAILAGSVSAKGFFVVAPSFRLEELEPLLHTARRDVTGYIVVGKKDWVYEPVMQFAQKMRDAGLECIVEEHEDLGHNYPVDFASSLRQGLAFIREEKEFTA